jgi:hypothetical protein
MRVLAVLFNPGQGFVGAVQRRARLLFSELCFLLSCAAHLAERSTPHG